MQIYTFDQLQVGQRVEFTRKITPADTQKFIELSGDTNPLHTDKVYAAGTAYRQPIVHGMLLGSLFSALVGVYLPGKYSLYLSQTLEFRQPLIADQPVIVRGEVIKKVNSLKIVDIKTSIIDKYGKTTVTGLAKVKVIK